MYETDLLECANYVLLPTSMFSAEHQVVLYLTRPFLVSEEDESSFQVH